MLRLHCLLLSPLLLSGVALAQDGGGLPIPDLLDEARRSAPSVEVARAGLESAEHSVGSALSLHLPRVSVSERQTYRYNNPEKYSFDYTFEEGGQCFDGAGNPCLPVVVIDGQITAPENRWSNSVSLTGIQPVLAPRQIVGIKQAQARVEIAELQVKGGEEQLVLDLISTYFDLQASLAEAEVYAKSLSLVEELESNLVVRVDTGQSTTLDLERARLDVEEAQVRQRQAMESQGLIAAEMALVSGVDGSDGFRVCKAAPAKDAGRDLLLEESTRLMLLEHQVKMSELSLQAARTGLMPTLNVVGGVSYTGSGESLEAVVESFMFDSWFVGGTLSLSLFEGGGRYHSNRSAKLDVKADQAKLSQERQEALLSDQQLAKQLSDISEDLALLDRSIVLTEANVYAIKSRYLAGMATFEIWTHARQSLESLRLRRVAAVQQQWQLAAYRWISAGQIDDLLGWVEETDSAASSQGSCQKVTVAPMEAR